MKTELHYLKMAIQMAKISKDKGNLPYGCVLVNSEGDILLKGENSIVTENDCLGHAEINLIREASKKYSFEELNQCTIYTSDEPCPMCSSAIFWSGIKKLVYGLSKKRYYDLVGRDNANFHFEVSCREVFIKGGRKVEVQGPFLEEEVAVLHME